MNHRVERLEALLSLPLMLALELQNITSLLTKIEFSGSGERGLLRRDRRAGVPSERGGVGAARRARGGGGGNRCSCGVPEGVCTRHQGMHLAGTAVVRSSLTRARQYVSGALSNRSRGGQKFDVKSASENAVRADERLGLGNRIPLWFSRWFPRWGIESLFVEPPPVRENATGDSSLPPLIKLSAGIT